MTGNARYPGCKDFIADNSRGSFDAGVCGECLMASSIRGVSTAFARPAGFTNGQSVRVVVAYMDRNPAQLHEAFRTLLFVPCVEAWPCR